MSVFVDTSVWYAAVDRGDRSHARAKELLSAQERLTTTDHVLVESWFLLRARIRGDVAKRFWDGLRRGVAVIEPVIAEDLEVAWTIGETFPDQDFSLVDRTSFAVMQRLGIMRAASFDPDFAVYRFGPGRKHAFELVR